MKASDGKDARQGMPVPLGQGEQVLVIDGDPASLYCIGGMLLHLGYGVVRAESARSALCVLHDEAQPIDLVIMDHHLPDMRGIELVQSVRRLKRRAPVILTTGYDDLAVYLAVVTMHDVLFLQKPMGVRDLGVLVRAALERRSDGYGHAMTTSMAKDKNGGNEGRESVRSGPVSPYDRSRAPA